MMHALKLEIFSEAPQEAEETASDLAEAAPDPGFEAGYAAGWQAALAARTEEMEDEAAEVTRALQALEFTFHDARAHVLRSLAPLLEEMVAKVLPRIAEDSLPHLISEALQPLVDLAADTPVELVIHPAMRETVEAHLARQPGLPVVIVAAAEQPPARVTLRLGERETRIDIRSALDAIEDLLRTAFDHPSQEARYG